MEIIVTHLTRMRRGHICAAGPCLEDGRHVRPVLKGGHNLGVNMLARNGGPFALGRRLHLGQPQRAELLRPHLEDWIVCPQDVKLLAEVTPREFWTLLARLCAAGWQEAFGSDLERIGATAFGTRPGKGEASLAYLRLEAPLALHVREREEGKRQLRAEISAGGLTADLAVTDKRLYTGHAHVLNEPLIERLQQALSKSRETIVAIGLGRAYPAGDPQAINWLQVNNIYPQECPLWTDAASLAATRTVN